MQKTAYEMRISDWSSDVCSSDLHRKDRDKQRQIPRQRAPARRQPYFGIGRQGRHSACPFGELLDASPKTIKDAVCAPAVVSHATWKTGRASCRDRGCQYV